jgi:hypothetical protein
MSKYFWFIISTLGAVGCFVLVIINFIRGDILSSMAMVSFAIINTGLAVVWARVIIRNLKNGVQQPLPVKVETTTLPNGNVR